jgi:DNA-binding NarL/FixJ family response regulator
MDLQMPEMNGLERWSQSERNFPMRRSSLATYKGNVRRHEAGARGYLLKTKLDKELVGTTRAAYSGN